MKKSFSIIFISVLIIFQSCINEECPPEPLNEADIAGYIDGSTGILFTTANEKTAVLESLHAMPHSETTYRMPVFEIGEQQVYLIFRVTEVEEPSRFVNFQFEDYCYNDLFISFERELMELIELNGSDLADQFIIACGDAVGRLGAKENEKVKINKGKEKEALDALKKKKEGNKALKKELTEKARQKGNEAKEALNNNDKNGAMEKAKELVDETKYKFDLKYDWDYCDEWRLKLDYGYFWTEEEPVVPPELINEFTNANIRYRVYKDAECGPGPATLSLICYRPAPLIQDTLKPVIPAVWTSQEHQFRNVCERGTGFCVEQEVVVLIEKDYSDAECKRLINVRQFKDFACFN